MKKVIRLNVFETNSSTQHSLIILPNDIYKKWKNSDLYVYDGYYEGDNAPKSDVLFTFDDVVDCLLLHGSHMGLSDYAMELLNKYKDENIDNNEVDEDGMTLKIQIEDIIKEHDFYTFEEWNGGDWPLEEDETIYTTNSGDKIAIRAKFGYDG